MNPNRQINKPVRGCTGVAQKLNQTASTSALRHQQQSKDNSSLNNIPAAQDNATIDHEDMDFDMTDTNNEMVGSHLIQPSSTSLDKKAQLQSSMNQDSSTMINSSLLHSATGAVSQVISEFSMQHPTLMLPRDSTHDVERQNLNLQAEYADHIDQYTRQLESQYTTEQCLLNHKITPALRARMVDWMIEVLTNFKCDDQTFFLASSLLDRFLKNSPRVLEIGELHLIGVTSMFVASKYEDI